MSYLIIEMLFYLLVTAVLGLLAGGLARDLMGSRRRRAQEEAWRRQLRQSEARAGNLKNQLAEAFLVEERLRADLGRLGERPAAAGPSREELEELRARLARRDKKIEVLKLQVGQSEAALSSEWQSLKALKADLAERQQRLKERGKQISDKLKDSEETRRLQVRSLKRQNERMQQELAVSQQALASERQKAAAHVAELEARLEEQETVLTLLSAEEETPRVSKAATAGIPETVEAAAAAPEAATGPGASAEPGPVDEPEADDLQRIRGIGPVLHRKLNRIGVTSFRQIAGWTEDDVAEVARRIGGSPDRILKGGWVEAARELQHG